MSPSLWAVLPSYNEINKFRAEFEGPTFLMQQLLPQMVCQCHMYVMFVYNPEMK
jgi:hypothetical protein